MFEIGQEVKFNYDGDYYEAEVYDIYEEEGEETRVNVQVMNDKFQYGINFTEIELSKMLIK